MKLSVRSVFSRYALTPARGLNFGPMEFNTVAKPRIFEITNLGEFPVDFNLTSLSSSGKPTSASRAAAAAAAPPPAKGGKGAPVEAVVTGAQFGPFNVTPAKGSIAPGEKVEVTVVFTASGNMPYREILGVDVSNRDPDDHPLGVPYEIVGESCFPGIIADSVNSIFEEVHITPALDPFNPRDKEFGLSERLFNFGGVLANLDGSAESTSSTALKFTNPNKIPCTVNFAIKPRGKFSAELPFPIEVDPPMLVIPPSEYR